MPTTGPADFEEYARRFPTDVQALLRKMRAAIREAAPQASYKSAKGSVQFPFGEPMPIALVHRIVKFLVERPRNSPRR